MLMHEATQILFSPEPVSSYRLSLWPAGSNADRYCGFMKITSDQVKGLGGMEKLYKEAGISANPLKAIDECNYVTAQGWKLP
jgi:hypothetical protein